MPVETHHVIREEVRDANGVVVSYGFLVDGNAATEAQVRSLVARKKTEGDLKLTSETKRTVAQ